MLYKSFLFYYIERYVYISKFLPIEGSSIKPLTLVPEVSTIIVAAPYRAYPATTSSLPGFSTSFSISGGSTPQIVLRLYTANIDPIDTKQSMLLDPSNGSKQTTYEPYKHKKSARCISKLRLPFLQNIIFNSFRHIDIQFQYFALTCFSASTSTTLSISSDTKKLHV